jgi:hypothetical protein
VSKYRFSPHERLAVYTVHGYRCYQCGTPVYLLPGIVDHVIPESLEGTEDLANVLHELGRPPDFSVNSYENWMPCCSPCNGRKSDKVWESSPRVQLLLQDAAGKADLAREIEATSVARHTTSKAINTLERHVPEWGDSPDEWQRMATDRLAELLARQLAPMSGEERTELAAFADLADIVADRLGQPKQPVLVAPGLSVLRGVGSLGVCR